MTKALTFKDVSVRFGAFSALKNISAEFERNKTYAIIGPNGAGKTTLINVLSGVFAPATGTIVLNDKDVTRLRSNHLASMGVGRSFQIIKVFDQMTARNNLRLAAQRLRYRFPPFWLVAGHDPVIERLVDEILSRVNIERFADVEASLLSHGNQRALELGLTLIARPSLLLLDEPLAGVGHHELPEMIALLQQVRRECTTIIVEHNMDAVMSLADEVLVMVAGEILVRGTPAEVSQHPKVRAAYLGT